MHMHTRAEKYVDKNCMVSKIDRLRPSTRSFLKLFHSRTDLVRCYSVFSPFSGSYGAIYLYDSRRLPQCEREKCSHNSVSHIYRGTTGNRLSRPIFTVPLFAVFHTAFLFLTIKLCASLNSSLKLRQAKLIYIQL